MDRRGRETQACVDDDGWLGTHPFGHHSPTRLYYPQNEVAERRAFVTKTKQALVKVYNNLESDYVKSKIANDERDVST